MLELRVEQQRPGFLRTITIVYTDNEESKIPHITDFLCGRTLELSLDANNAVMTTALIALRNAFGGHVTAGAVVRNKWDVATIFYIFND